MTHVGHNGAAFFMSKHHDQRSMQMLNRIFNRTEFKIANYVSCGTNDETDPLFDLDLFHQGFQAFAVILGADSCVLNVEGMGVAAKEAETWTKGLADWGQSKERIQTLREKVDMAIYTPGSNAGLPVSILSSLDAPSEAVMEDREMLADRIESTVSSMLGLMGLNADPVQSKEHILLSNIVAHFWAKGQNLSLEVLVHAIQQPPIRKVGVVDMDSFLPEAKRSDLAMKLNNLLASPGFGVWLEGEPLDIQRMYFTPEGKPRISIFCISHLSDSERMFFVSMLMNQLLGWMRRP
jgi:hypothetical protein